MDGGILLNIDQLNYFRDKPRISISEKNSSSDSNFILEKRRHAAFFSRLKSIDKLWSAFLHKICKGNFEENIKLYSLV